MLITMLKARLPVWVPWLFLWLKKLTSNPIKH